jgi:hypothetical protein
MRRLAAIAAVLALSAAPAPAARAQGLIIFGTSKGVKVTDIEFFRAKLTGGVSVEFHGDSAAGCAEHGLCGVSGTVTWSPAGIAELGAIGFREHGQRFESGLIAFAGENDSGTGGGRPTSAHVRRAGGAGGAPSGLCADSSAQEFGLADLGTQAGSSLAVSLTGAGGGFVAPDNFRTRCAGPSRADVRDLLPTRILSARELRRGRITLDYTADRSFATSGLAGTLHSDVTVRLGAARRLDLRSPQGGAGEPPFPTRRRRHLEVAYRIERVSGQAVTSVGGLTDPDLCGPLDSCGLLGTVTVAPRATDGSLFVDASAAAGRSDRDLRRAVGLAPGPPPSGITVFGGGSWDSDFGTVTSSLTRAGAADCRDEAAIAGGGSLSLAFTRRGVRAAYGDTDGGSGSDPLRTRCEGPGLADVARSRPLASGVVPLRAFGRSHVTLRLTSGAAFSSDGYSGRTAPDVTVELQRVRVSRSVQSEPAFRTLRGVLHRAVPAVALRAVARIVRRDRSGDGARAHGRAPRGGAR